MYTRPNLSSSSLPGGGETDTQEMKKSPLFILLLPVLSFKAITSFAAPTNVQEIAPVRDDLTLARELDAVSFTETRNGLIGLGYHPKPQVYRHRLRRRDSDSDSDSDSNSEERTKTLNEAHARVKTYLDNTLPQAREEINNHALLQLKDIERLKKPLTTEERAIIETRVAGRNERVKTIHRAIKGGHDGIYEEFGLDLSKGELRDIETSFRNRFKIPPHFAIYPE